MRALALFLVAIVDFGFAESDTRIDPQVCGQNSLALAASFANDVGPDQVHSLLDPSHAPFSLHDLDVAAQKAEVRTAVLRWRDKRQARFDCPAILHVRANESSTACDHSITCFGERGDFLCVADFPRPPTLVSREWLLTFWDGDALYLDKPNGARIDALTRRDYSQPVLYAVVGIAGALFIWLTGRKRALRRSALVASGKETSPGKVDSSAKVV